ncbi:hypothetical protein HETIRDRAFT_51882 [Heterobasidion irregulare TC 32-1]|uniref:PH domain-containing protein n=1 Tax=Heterobasidion irregulare (strain TC 32-1) TaxID=747525 RepID=W4K873_HETIT|nr:uncharacterized protein HETIRDRAFT_51882 [Heterobasidion irregulare TC 32-1]ETW81550.1 hypothetical protein HETIRDRAFT_51882 [Heterobasidion irregulare TC 32-1]
MIASDRMIVRVSYTRERSLGATFDENQNRFTQHLQYEDWAEFMVVWRKDRIELYEDYTIPLKEWVTGHKHLAFIAPLNTPRTKLSLYSFTDLSFCIACPPTAVESVSKSRWHFHRAKEGLNIFVFKHRRRSRAVDWTWHLWRRLGGRFPPFIEIRVPLVDIRLKIDIPDSANDQTNADLTSFTKANLIELCVKALGRIQDWKMLIQRQLEMGAQLELAWRMGTQLDWVWWQEDIEGKEREWAVLAGLALSQAGKAAHLEIRRSEHLPSRVHLKDGVRLEEPPSIEGFLERVKPATQVRQPIYLTIHDGLLFSLPPPRAHPPRPPGSVPEPASLDDDFHTTMRNEEAWRGAQQVSEARGVTDLRSIVLVRRAFQKPAQDRVHIRMRRCFELVMSTGRIVRFETYSCKTAIEWINRLRTLIQYWKARHDMDARQEMDIQAAPEPASDLSAILPSLNHLYNWCVLDGCRAITKTGRVFVQKGFRGRYKLVHVQLFIVAGHLIQYHMKTNSVHHRRRGKGISLLDAYIASGVFAAQSLPRGQYKPNTPPMARRYQDGLESADPDEDTLFVVYYYPLNVETGITERPGKGNRVGKDKEAVPNLSTKRKLMVFRTRSRVERDVWCWALNAEIEKVVRTKKEREEKLRHAGGLIRT